MKFTTTLLFSFTLVLVFSSGVFAQTYTTVANGNWNSAGTWQGGSIPPTGGTIPTGATINIRHTVAYNTGNPIKLDGLFRIEPTVGTTARLDVPTNINVEVFSAGRFFVTNGSFVQYRFVPGNDGQPYSGTNPGAVKNSGTFKNIGGRFESLNSFVEIAQDFVNESGGIRILENTCLKTGQNFSLSGSSSSDTLLGTNITVGWHGSGNFTSADGTMNMQALRIQVAGTGGSVQFNSGTINGDVDYITLRNHIVPFVGSGEVFASSSVTTSGINLDAYCVNAPPKYVPNGKFSGTHTSTCALNYFPGDCPSGGAAPNAGIDLSLAKSVDNTGCFSNGVTRIFTLTATNNDDNFVGTDVVVNDLLPAGTNFVSSSGHGSYVSGTGIWTVGDILPGQVRSRTITVTMSGIVDVTNTALFGTVNQPDTNAVNNTSAVTLLACPPSAAPALIQGRVVTANGQGIRNVIVEVSGGSLQTPMMTTTGTFGRFKFNGLEAGQTYIVAIRSKRYVFENPVQLVNLFDDVHDLDFVASTGIFDIMPRSTLKLDQASPGKRTIFP